jgi:hypothetical protein
MNKIRQNVSTAGCETMMNGYLACRNTLQKLQIPEIHFETQNNCDY